MFHGNKNFYCICKPSPIFRAFTIPELFTIISAKCHNYTTEGQSYKKHQIQIQRRASSNNTDIEKAFL